MQAGISDYSFGDGAELGGDQPWDRIREYGFGATMFFAPADRIQAMVIPNVRWQSETGASLDDGRTESVIAGASYKFSDDFSIGPGIGWSSQLGGGSSVFPILLLDWNITESLNITTRPDLAVGSGPGLTVSQDLGRGFELGVTARYENTRFRLADTTSTEDGIGQNSGFPVIASISFQPYPALRVQGFLGVKLGGELRLRDRRGETIEMRDHQSAPLVGIAVRARF